MEHGTGVAATLRAPRAVSSIEGAFASADGCTPTAELKALWSWRDGSTGAVPFIWYHDFLPLDDALAEYRSLLANPLVRWDPRYVPIFSFEGEWYAAYCGPEVTVAGPIVHFFLEDEARITHVNLAVLLAGMAEAMRTGAVRWRDGAMVDDIRALHRIHQRRNPGYPFPYHVPP